MQPLPQPPTPMLQFNGQRPGETVRLVAHQHPLVLLPAFLVAGLFLAVGVAGLAFFNRGILLSIVLLAAPIAAIIRILVAVYCWRRTLVLVTNERVGFFYQRGLFEREFYEAPHVAIVQVSHKVHGPLQTMFGYGTVIINTGDAESSIYIKDVPDPFDIQQEIQSTLNAA